jgi:hypothetical protein
MTGSVRTDALVPVSLGPPRTNIDLRTRFQHENQQKFVNEPKLGLTNAEFAAIL